MRPYIMRTDEKFQAPVTGIRRKCRKNNGTTVLHQAVYFLSNRDVNLEEERMEKRDNDSGKGT